MRLLFSTLLAIASIASADPVPVLVWSGVANVTGGFYLEPANASVIPNGLSGSDSWSQVVGGGSIDFSNSYDATTAFTVTSAGDFQLSGTGVFALSDSTCTDFQCAQIGADLQPLELDLITTVSILDSMGNTIATESFSGSASALYGGCQLFPQNNEESCVADAQLNTSIPSGTFDLSSGDYTLDVNVSSVADNVYGNVITGGSELEGDVSPIATPEPRHTAFLAIAISCGVLLLKRRARKCPRVPAP